MNLYQGMPNQSQFGPREREVLTAIVETYIISGEPIGSRTLARANSEGLSPASIRNVMSDLTDAGFLEQPHTSAGRVPTSAAFEYYVQQLAPGHQISLDDKGRIEQGLHGINDVQNFMEKTSHILLDDLAKPGRCGCGQPEGSAGAYSLQRARG